MPTYQYACASCTNSFEQYQSYAEDPLTVCPACEGTIRRVIQPVGVVFKGSGWYLTDSRKPEKTTDGKTESTDNGKDKTADSPAESKAADGSKPEAPAKKETTAKKPEPATSTKSVESKSATTTSSSR